AGLVLRADRRLVRRHHAKGCREVRIGRGVGIWPLSGGAVLGVVKGHLAAVGVPLWRGGGGWQFGHEESVELVVCRVLGLAGVIDHLPEPFGLARDPVGGGEYDGPSRDQEQERRGGEDDNGGLGWGHHRGCASRFWSSASSAMSLRLWL